MRRYYPQEYGDRGVTPQAFLRDKLLEANHAVDVLQDKASREAQGKFMISTGIKGEMENLERCFKEQTGNPIDFSRQSTPAKDSPLGIILAKIDAKYDKAKEKLQQAWVEASLRINLGKDPNSIMRSLERFCQEMTAMVKKLGGGETP